MPVVSYAATGDPIRTEMLTAQCYAWVIVDAAIKEIMSGEHNLSMIMCMDLHDQCAMRKLLWASTDRAKVGRKILP